MTTIGDHQLVEISKRKGVPLPPAKTRIHIRGLYQFHEVLERFGSGDPTNYSDIIGWFKTNRGSLPTHPDGRKVWLDLCKTLGYEPQAYDKTPTNDPLKLQIEHWFCQHLAGDRKVLINGIVGLYMCEQAYNNSPEFKCAGSPAKDAFFGPRAAKLQQNFIDWVNTKENYKLPSTCFLQSTFANGFEDITTPIYLSSGLRATGRTRQLMLPFLKRDQPDSCGEMPVAKKDATHPASKRVREADDGDRVEIIDDGDTNSEGVLMTRIAVLEKQLNEALARERAYKQQLESVRGTGAFPATDEGVEAEATTPGAFVTHEELLHLTQPTVFPRTAETPVGLCHPLKDHQKRSLAFMLDIESSTTNQIWSTACGRDADAARGGWLCDEVGMGKTCVCIALILARPPPPPPPSPLTTTGVVSMGDVRLLSGITTLPITVVVTTNTLLGQWEEEFAKFAPSIRVGWYYSRPGLPKGHLYFNIHNVDVVLTTHGTKLFSELPTGAGFRIHRLIIDEAHLPQSKRFYQNHGPVTADNVWAVTGTPICSSLTDDLRLHARQIGHWDRGLKLDIITGSVFKDRNCIHYMRALREEVPLILRHLMVRHTKKMYSEDDSGDGVAGDDAAMPMQSVTNQLIWLDMDDTERRAYDRLCRSDPIHIHGKVTNMFRVEVALSKHISACSGILGENDHHGSKFQYLLQDVRSLCNAISHPSVVIFTHTADHHDTFKLALQSIGVCVFTLDKYAVERHEAIRSFQTSETEGIGKAFLCTIKMGSVGLTLTAANRIYFMDTCIDTTTETQAIGRIHRIGQRDDVFVKRLCYKDAVDELILQFRERLDSRAWVVFSDNLVFADRNCSAGMEWEVFRLFNRIP